MIIKISKHIDNLSEIFYKADLQDLPGTPPIGTGKNLEEAVSSLFFRIFQDGLRWIKHIDLEELKVVNES